MNSYKELINIASNSTAKNIVSSINKAGSLSNLKEIIIKFPMLKKSDWKSFFARPRSDTLLSFYKPISKDEGKLEWQLY